MRSNVKCWITIPQFYCSSQLNLFFLGMPMVEGLYPSKSIFKQRMLNSSRNSKPILKSNSNPWKHNPEQVSNPFFFLSKQACILNKNAYTHGYKFKFDISFRASWEIIKYLHLLLGKIIFQLKMVCSNKSLL